MVHSTVTEVSERAQLALRSSPIYALRELRVERTGEALYISGSVSSFYQKQLAQELVRSVADELTVVNSIDVQ